MKEQGKIMVKETHFLKMKQVQQQDGFLNNLASKQNNQCNMAERKRIKMMKLYDFRTEYRENPIGLTDRAPRFSWKINSEEQNTIQTAYEINVTDENGNAVWNSGKKESDQSVLIPYEGEKLKDEMLYKVEVSVTDNH